MVVEYKFNLICNMSLKSRPQIGQANWGTVLNDHIGQLMDPTYGGFNIVDTIEDRDNQFWANGNRDKDSFAGKTIYCIETGTFMVWTVDNSLGQQGRVWKELGKNTGVNPISSIQMGTGSLSFEHSPNGNKSYLVSENIGNISKIGSFIKTDTQTLLVKEVINQNKVEVSIVDYKLTNLSSVVKATGKTAERTITITDGTPSSNFKVGDYIFYEISDGRYFTTFVTEIVNANTLKCGVVSLNPQANIFAVASTVVNKNYSVIAPIKTLRNIDNNASLTVSPDGNLDLRTGISLNSSKERIDKVVNTNSLVSDFEGTNILLKTKKNNDNSGSSNVFALNVQSVRWGSDDGNGYIKNLYGISVNSGIRNNSTNTETVIGVASSSTNFTGGKSKEVINFFANGNPLAANGQRSDKVWNFVGTNSSNKTNLSGLEGKLIVGSGNRTLNSLENRNKASDLTTNASLVLPTGNLKIKGNEELDRFDQGFYINWNSTINNNRGLGRTKFINSRGLGAGGYEFYDGKSGSTEDINRLLVIAANGNATLTGSLTQNSDISLKKNISTLSNSLGIVLKLRGVSFQWKDENREKEKQLGFIAQEVEQVIPEIVKTDENGIKSVGYANIVPVLVEAIKELTARVTELEAKLV